eukprot:s1334_g6.t1
MQEHKATPAALMAAPLRCDAKAAAELRISTSTSPREVTSFLRSLGTRRDGMQQQVQRLLKEMKARTTADVRGGTMREN